MTIRTSLAALLLAAFCPGCSPALRVTPTLTSGANLSQGRRTPQAVFGHDDRVVVLVDVGWADPAEDGGIHTCQWNWFRDGVLVSQGPVLRFHFLKTPTTLHAARAAAPLGAGRFTVQTMLDGSVVATTPFTIAGWHHRRAAQIGSAICSSDLPSASIPKRSAIAPAPSISSAAAA